MEQNIEEFKKKITESKQTTINLDDICYFDHLFRIQNEYGSDYKPRRKLTLFGYKDICPNCSKRLQTKYYGQKWNDFFNKFFQYYIKQCYCGYKYAYTELTSNSNTKVPKSVMMSFDYENLK